MLGGWRSGVTYRTPQQSNERIEIRGPCFSLHCVHCTRQLDKWTCTCTCCKYSCSHPLPGQVQVSESGVNAEVSALCQSVTSPPPVLRQRRVKPCMWRQASTASGVPSCRPETCVVNPPTFFSLPDLNPDLSLSARHYFSARSKDLRTDIVLGPCGMLLAARSATAATSYCSLNQRRSPPSS